LVFSFVIIPLIIGIVIYQTSFLAGSIISNYLPDFLWSFSFSFFNFSISNFQFSNYSIWSTIGTFALVEIFQKTGIMEGTFDFIDLLVYLLAFFIALLIAKYRIKR
jgi:hypothetical protein